MFYIESCSGRNIARYSAFANEEEVLLLPGTRLRIENINNNVGGGVCFAALKEEPEADSDSDSDGGGGSGDGGDGPQTSANKHVFGPVLSGSTSFSLALDLPEPLGRAHAVLQQAAADDIEGSASYLQQLQLGLRQALSALVAVREPLQYWRDIEELCMGAEAMPAPIQQAMALVVGVDDWQTPSVATAVSLSPGLAAALKEPTRCGPYALDERAGHGILALAALRVLRQKGLLGASQAVVQPEEVAGDASVQYALHHGHVHLVRCVELAVGENVVRTWQQQEALHLSHEALRHWQHTMLASRPALAVKPQQYALSSYVATTAMAHWLLLASYTAQRKWSFVKELLDLSKAFGEKPTAMGRLWREVARLYGSQWVSTATPGEIVRNFFLQVPVTGPLFASPAASALSRATSCALPCLRLPPLLHCGAVCLNSYFSCYSVVSVACSPDGRLIVSGGNDGAGNAKLEVRSATTGENLQALIGHKEYVKSVAYSPDGQCVVSGSGDKTVRIWSAATGEPMHVLVGHSKTVASVAYSPDGQYIASGSHDETVRMWDAATGKSLNVFEGHSGSVNSVACSPDGQCIVSGSCDKTLRTWSTAMSKLLYVSEGHSGSINSVACSSCGQRIVSGSCDKTVRVWEAATGKPLHILKGHSESVSSVAYSPDGQRIVFGSADQIVRVWNTKMDESLHTFYTGYDSPGASTKGVNSVTYSPNGQSIMLGSGGHVQVWDPTTSEPMHALVGHSESVTSVAYSPGGQYIASGSFDKTIRVWNPATGESHKVLEGHSEPVISVACSPDGQHIVSGSRDKTVRVWNAATGEPLHVLEGHNKPTTLVSYDSRGEHIVSGSVGDTIKVWNAKTGKPLLTFSIEGELGDSIACSPDGQRIVSGSTRRRLRTWNAVTGEPLLALDHYEEITSVTYSPDGRRIVAGGHYQIQVVDAETGKPLHSFRGAGGGRYNDISSVACSPDGQRIVSSRGGGYGIETGFAVVCDAATGAALHELEGHSDGMTSVAYSPDGRRIVSTGNEDKIIWVWDVMMDEL
jgi:WD40 repeat protein